LELLLLHAVEEAVRPLGLAAEVDELYSVDIRLLFAAVWTWDSEFGGELAVLGDPRSTYVTQF